MIRRTVAPLVLLAWLALAAGRNPARAGERLTIDELVDRSQGAVLVDVELEPNEKKGVELTVVRVIHGFPADITSPPSWIGGCTGSAKHLRRWLHEHPTWPAAKLWRRALQVRHYKALLFLHPARETQQIVPYCETEAMLMLHTSLHPDFAAYLNQVEDALARRSGRQPPK